MKIVLKNVSIKNKANWSVLLHLIKISLDIQFPLYSEPPVVGHFLFDSF